MSLIYIYTRPDLVRMPIAMAMPRWSFHPGTNGPGSIYPSHPKSRDPVAPDNINYYIYILLWFTMIDCHGETLPTSLKRVETCWNDLNSIIRSRVVVWRDIDWKAVDNASSSAMLTSSESILESKSWESVGIMTPLVEDLFMTFPLYNVFFQPYVIYKTMGVTNDISNFNAKNPQIHPNHSKSLPSLL